MEPRANDAADTCAGCVSCGSPSAHPVDTPDGRVVMCRPCVVLNGLGCP